MAQLPDEMIEQILIRSEVSDLIRYRSVSKSWKDVISDPDFIKAHLENSYRRDREYEKMGNRRIAMSATPQCNWEHLFDADNLYFVRRTRQLLGSSNGLICVSPSRTEFSVINPETREVNKLKKPEILDQAGPLIYGFGYDSSNDDYKVVLGFRKGNNLTCFLKFSLESNIWEVIGEVNYTFITRVGVLYSGALHWVVSHGTANNKKHVILSFDLSDAKFEEIPQTCQRARFLGTMCVFHGQMFPLKVQVMNEYNVKQSWELVGPNRTINSKVVQQLKDLKYYIPSLVSPHVLKKQDKRQQEISITESRKVPKLCHVSTSSCEVGNLERPKQFEYDGSWE
ncbi:hypothetical protein Lser_V15G02688 [Lactuca serriola]